MGKSGLKLGNKGKILMLRSKKVTKDILLTNIDGKLSKILEVEYVTEVNLVGKQKLVVGLKIDNNSMLDTLRFSIYKAMYIVNRHKENGEKPGVNFDMTPLDFKIRPLKYLGNGNWLNILKIFGITIIAYNNKPIFMVIDGKELKHIDFKLADDNVSIDSYISFTTLSIRNHDWEEVKKAYVNDTKIYQKRENRKNYLALDLTSELNIDSIRKLGHLLSEYENNSNYSIDNWRYDTKHSDNVIYIETEDFTLDIDLDRDNIISVYNKLYILYREMYTLDNELKQKIFEAGASVDYKLSIRCNKNAMYYNEEKWTQKYSIVFNRLMIIGDHTRILRVLYLDSPINTDEINTSNASGIMTIDMYNELPIMGIDIKNFRCISHNREVSLLDRLRILRATRTNDEGFFMNLSKDSNVKLIYSSNYTMYDVTYGHQYGEVVGIDNEIYSEQEK